MFKLTDRRLEKAKPVLEKHRADLLKRGSLVTHVLEKELRDCWNGMHYQPLKSIMKDMLRNPRYRLVAAYYMQHQNAPGPVSEFKQPLADLYGVTHYHADDREEKQRKFWEKALKKS